MANHRTSPRRRRSGRTRAPSGNDVVEPMPQEDSDQASTTEQEVTDDEASELRKKKVVLLANEAKKKRWESWWRRFWMSILMIGAFFAWLFLARQSGIVLLVLVTQANIYRELVGLAIRENKERELPGFSAFYFYWFFVAVFFIYGRTLMVHLRHHDWGNAFNFVLDHHGILTWAMYIAGIVGFVMSLKKRKLYRYQFKQFAFCHMALIVVVFQSTFLAENVFNGLLWFTLPCGMVVCNDCFAYIFGFFFGKTPLIRLSPKKTWEGFMGGFIMTLIWSFWFAGVLQGYNFMTCPKVGFSMDLGNCDMAASPLAEMYRLYPLASFLPAEWASTLPAFLATFQLSSLQVHALVMAVFASLVAPFGGFFASGFKRAFKIKDFGDTIPGHGGFTDRMDCQIIMGLFVYVYITHVVGIPGSAVSKLFSKVTALPAEQQMDLLQQLAAHLGHAVVPV